MRLRAARVYPPGMSMPRWWPVLGLVVWAALLALLHGRGALDEYALAQLLMTFGPLVTVPLGLSLTPASPDAPDARRLRWLFPPLALGALGLAAVIAVDPAPALRVGLTAPYLLFAAAAALHGLLRLVQRRSLALPELAVDAALASLGVAGVWLLVANADLVLDGFGGLWAMLTAAHFHFAGFGALLYVGLLGRARATVARSSRFSWPYTPLACGLLVALPVLALGISSSRVIERVGVGMYVVLLPWLAALPAPGALPGRAPLAARGRLLLSTACVLLSTTYAGLYGYRGHVPWDISISTMLYVHASVNALGFIGLGLWGWRDMQR